MACLAAPRHQIQAQKDTQEALDSALMESAEQQGSV